VAFLNPLATVLVLGPGVLVPADPLAVASKAIESVLLFVKAKAVHGVDLCLFRVLGLLAVTFEAEGLAIALVRQSRVVHLDAAAALDRTNAEALSIRKTLDCRCGVLQSRLKNVSRLKVVALKALLEIPNMEEALLMSSNQQRPGRTHIVHRHGDVNVRLALELRRGLPCPKLHFAVPTT